MKKNKPNTLFNKIGTLATIVGAAATVLGVSIFGGKSLFNNSETDDSKINLENNEIEIGDQSPIIIGDNNTINYDGTKDIDQNNQSNRTSTTESDDLLVVASYKINPLQVSNQGIDVLVTAITSFPAERVTISSLSDDDEETSFNMYGDENNWWFNANFYIKGIYTITITAYNEDGTSASDVFVFEY